MTDFQAPGPTPQDPTAKPPSVAPPTPSIFEDFGQKFLQDEFWRGATPPRMPAGKVQRPYVPSATPEEPSQGMRPQPPEAPQLGPALPPDMVAAAEAQRVEEGNIRFFQALNMRRAEIMARNRGASQEHINRLMGDQWGMLAIQKQRAEDLGLDSQIVWEGTDVLNNELVESRWLAEMDRRMVITNAKMKDPEMAAKIDNMQVQYKSLLARHQAAAQHSLKVLNATKDPAERQALIDAIYPIVGHEEWMQWQKDIEEVNGALEQYRSGLNLFNHPDTRAMAKGLSTTVWQEQKRGFLQKADPKGEKGFFHDLHQLPGQATGSFIDEYVGIPAHTGLTWFRHLVQQGVNLKNWIEGDEPWDIGELENSFSYTYDERGNPVYSGDTFGSAEMLATMMNAMGREHAIAASHLSAMARSDREARDTFDDHTMMGFVNAGAAAVGSVAGYYKTFLKGPMGTMARVEDKLAQGGRAQHLLDKALQAEDLTAKSNAFIAGSTRTAKAIRRTAAVVAGGAHSAILHGAATGNLRDFGQAAVVGFAMVPVNMIVGAYGGRLEAALLGGKLRGPLWNFGVRAIRGLFEGAGFGAVGATTGIPLDPMFDAGSVEAELLQNYLHNPNDETSKAFFNYMAQWIFGNMIGQAVMGRSDTLHALHSRQQREQQRALREENVTNEQMFAAALGDEGQYERLQAVRKKQAKQRKKVQMKITKGELLSPEELAEYGDLVDVEKKKPIMKALATIGRFLSVEAASVTAAEKSGFRYQPIVDILEAGGGKFDVDPNGEVTLIVNDNLMARLMRNRMRAMTRLGEKITSGERRHEVKGGDEMGVYVMQDDQGNWLVQPLKGEQGSVSSRASYKALSKLYRVLKNVKESHWTNQDYTLLDQSQVVDLHSHPTASPFSEADIRYFLGHGWKHDAPAGKGYAPAIEINAEGGYVMRPRGDKAPKVSAPYINTTDLAPIERQLVEDGIEGKLGEVMRKFLHTKYEGKVDRVLSDLKKLKDAYYADRKIGTGDRMVMDIWFQARHQIHKEWAAKNNIEYGFFDPKTMAKRWDEYMETGKFSFEGAKDPLEMRMMVGSMVEQRIAQERTGVKPPEAEKPPAEKAPEAKPPEESTEWPKNPPIPQPKNPEAPETTQEIEDRIVAWRKLIPEDNPGLLRHIDEVLQHRRGESQHTRRTRFLNFLNYMKPTAEEGREAPGDPDYVKLWETLKPREGETIEQRHARILAEMAKQPPPPTAPPGKQPPTGFFQDAGRQEPTPEELAHAGRVDEGMRQAADREPTIAEQQIALRKGFDYQKTYWDSAKTVDSYASKIRDGVSRFFKNYFTNKDYRKELARKIRHGVGYGAKFLILGPDEDFVKSNADVMRQAVTVAAKNVRALRNRIYHRILEDKSLKPEQRQVLMDEVLQYAALLDLESNPTYTRRVETTHIDQSTGKPVTGFQDVTYERENPFGVSLEAIVAERKLVESRLTEDQRAAYVNLRAELDYAWETMVARGRASNTYKLKNYFPHKIIDWMEADHPSIGTTLPKQQPKRPYLMGREGSRRMFDTSFRAVSDYLIRVDVDNAKHDFLDTTARHIHERIMQEQGMMTTQWDSLRPEQWREIQDYMDMEGYVLLDTRYGRTGKETLERTPVVQKILADIMDQSGIAMMPEVVVGRNYRPNTEKGIYWVTKEYAQFIREQFASTAWTWSKTKAMNRLVGKWIKGPMLRGFMGVAAPERATRNLASDLHGIYIKGDGLRAVIETLHNVPEAWKIIKAWRNKDLDPAILDKLGLTDMQRSYLSELESHGTLQTNVRGQEWMRDDPVEIEWMKKTMPEVKVHIGRLLSQMYRADFKWAKALDDYSENILRVAYFLRERMERFKTLTEEGVPEAQAHIDAASYAHLRTGEVLVNYNHLTPIERHGLNGLMFTFYTWAKSNFFEIAAVTAERPMATAMRAALTSTPFIVWNALFAQDEEERLWNKNPALAAKPHMIFPMVRDSFGNPMVMSWDSTIGEAWSFLGMNQLHNDTFQYFTGHGDKDILAKDIVPGVFENMAKKWQNFTAPWVRAVGGQVFSSEFVTPAERAEQFLQTDLPKTSRPWSDLQAMLDLGKKERSKEERWLQFAPFVGFPDLFEGVTGEALPQHYMAGRIQRRESQLSQAIDNNMRRFTAGLRTHDTELMAAAVRRVWDDMGSELSEAGIEPVHLLSRFIERAVTKLSREQLINMGLTPKWLQLSRSQRAVLLLQLLERDRAK